MKLRKKVKLPGFLISVLAIGILTGFALFSPPHSQPTQQPDAAKSTAKLFKLKPSKKQHNATPVSAQSLLTPSPSQTTTLPVIHKSGTLTANETWTDGNVYMINNTVVVPDGLTLTVEAGAIIKSSTQAIQVNPGGVLDVQGSSTDPVIFTSYKDDSLGGDSNEDGMSQGSANDYSVAVVAQGGDVDMSHAIMQYGSESVGQWGTGGVSVTDSLLKSMVRSEFRNISLMRNEIAVDTLGSPALDLYGSNALSNVVLAGSNANTFTGTNKEMYVGNATIASGTEWSIDGVSGVVVHAGGTNIFGTLNLTNGVVVKTSDTAFNVYSGGVANVVGSGSDPVIFTSLRDDANSGDTNGDGPSIGSPNDYGIALNCQGGDINVTHAKFQYGSLAVDKLYAGTAIVTDSTFKSSLRANYPITLQRNSFDTQGYPYAIDAYNNRNLSAISLSGASSNSFTGNKTIYVGNAWVASGTTWNVDSSSDAVLFGGSVELYGTLNMGPGTIFKTTQNSEGLRVEQGGQLNASGTSSDPVIFTSYKDDANGGDTNADGTSSGSTNDYGNTIGIYGGITNVAHARFQYGSLAIDKLYGGDAQITDSTFKSAVRSHTPITLERNTFDVTPEAYGMALDIGGNNPELISLEGPNKNIFLGDDVSRVILAGYGGALQSGKTWTVDGSTGAVLYSTGINVYGDLVLQNGAILKDANSNAISVYAGGSVTVAGSASNRVIFTSYKDDAIGGDSNNDGPSNGSPQDGGTFFNMNGGSLNISYAKFMNAGLAIDQQYASSITANDSIFQIPVRARYDLHLARNQFDVDTNAAYAAGLDMQGVTNPSGVIMSGIDKNTFTGNGFGKLLVISNSTFPANTTWTIDGASGAVVQPDGTQVYGTLNITGNAVLKIFNGTGFSVKDGGVLNVGNSAAQVTITSFKDDANGGDTNNDSTASSPASGDYGTAFDLNSGGSLNANNLKVEYAGEALANYGGSATFEATDIDHVGNGLYVPSGDVTFRGTIKNVDSSKVTACDWLSTSCSVDATYTDWGNSTGPTNVCGKVLTVPWEYSGVDHNGILFINNCGSSTNPYQEVHDSGATFASVWQAAEEACDAQQPGYQDACDQVNRMHTCVNGAISIANSTSPFMLTNIDSYNEASGYADALNGDATNFIIEHAIKAAGAAKTASVYGYATQFGQLFGSMTSAFSSCR